MKICDSFLVNISRNIYNKVVIVSFQEKNLTVNQVFPLMALLYCELDTVCLLQLSYTTLRDL